MVYSFGPNSAPKTHNIYWIASLDSHWRDKLSCSRDTLHHNWKTLTSPRDLLRILWSADLRVSYSNATYAPHRGLDPRYPKFHHQSMHPGIQSQLFWNFFLLTIHIYTTLFIKGLPCAIPNKSESRRQLAIAQLSVCWNLWKEWDSFSFPGVCFDQFSQN